MAALAAQADRLVEWGYLGGQFRARPLESNPITIRALPNCYRVDADAADIIWDIGQHPEEGVARSLRLVYGTVGKTIWPPGTTASVIAPADPGWVSGGPFMGASSPVMTVEFSGHNYTEQHARSIATSLASPLGVGLSGGEANLTGQTIPVYSGGTRPVPYIHGGDWIVSQQGDAGPLYITRAHVNADPGYVDLTVGLSEDLLVEQLQAAGSATTVKLHKPHQDILVALRATNEDHDAQHEETLQLIAEHVEDADVRDGRIDALERLREAQADECAKQHRKLFEEEMGRMRSPHRETDAASDDFTARRSRDWQQTANDASAVEWREGQQERTRRYSKEQIVTAVLLMLATVAANSAVAYFIMRTLEAQFK